MQLHEIVLKNPEKGARSEVTVKVEDNHGKPLPGAKVALRFEDLNSGRSMYAHTSDPFSLKFTADATGSISIGGLCSSWYAWAAERDKFRDQKGTFFVRKEAQNHVTIVLPRPRIIHLEVVPQPDGTGVFKGKSTSMVLTENQSFYFDRVGPNGQKDRGYLHVRGYGAELSFVVDTSDGAWIVDVGQKELADIANANGLKPADTKDAPRPKCTPRHVYVMGTADNKHLKFRVTKIEQP